MSELPELVIEPIQVLMTIDQDIFDRMGSAVRHLCVGSFDEAVRVHVFSQSPLEGIGDSIGPSPVTTLPQTRLPWRRKRPEEVLNLLGGQRPHLVHCMSVELARQMEHWALAWNSVLVVHLTDLEDVDQFSHLSRQDRVAAIATTQTLHEAFLARYPKLEEHSCVVPFGIPAQSEPACLAQPARVPAVVTTAQMTRDSGLDRVLHSLRDVVRQGQEVQLFIMAGGPAERTYRRMTEQLNIRSQVTFAGPMGDWTKMSDALRGADFYVLPASRRRFTISTLLAMADGLAILAPRGTIGDYLIDGQTAFLFDTEDPRSLTERWMALLTDRTEARRLAHRALDFVRAYHKASTMVNMVTDFYRKIRHTFT